MGNPFPRYVMEDGAGLTIAKYLFKRKVVRIIFKSASKREAKEFLEGLVKNKTKRYILAKRVMRRRKIGTVSRYHILELGENK